MNRFSFFFSNCNTIFSRLSTYFCPWLYIFSLQNCNWLSPEFENHLVKTWQNFVSNFFWHFMKFFDMLYIFYCSLQNFCNIFEISLFLINFGQSPSSVVMYAYARNGHFSPKKQWWRENLFSAPTWRSKTDLDTKYRHKIDGFSCNTEIGTYSQVFQKYYYVKGSNFLNYKGDLRVILLKEKVLFWPKVKREATFYKDAQTLITIQFSYIPPPSPSSHNSAFSWEKPPQKEETSKNV